MGKNISNPFRGCLTFPDIQGAADPVCAAGEFVQIGCFTVPDGTALALGFGSQEGQESAQGRIYVKLIDDTAGNVTEEPGTLRLELRNPRNIPVRTLFESRTEALSASTTRPDQLPFAQMRQVATEGWKIVALFKADAADTLQRAYCVARIDCTYFDYSIS